MARSSAVDGASWLLTFGDHPDALVLGEAPPPIESLDRRIERLSSTGLDAVWVLEFDERLREMSAEEFVVEVFVRRLGVRAVLLGEDARFGRSGRGTVQTLESLGSEHGFEVEAVPAFLHDGRPISSTRIRKSVLEGDLPLAEALLGRPYSIEGRVGTGDGRGRSIGVPTANLVGSFPLLPPEGVYVTSVRSRSTASAASGEPIPAVTNIGRRPTFDGGTPGPSRVSVETHLLDFEGDLVGSGLELELHAKIRPEERFEDAGALVRRIREDVETARTFHRSRRAAGGK